MNIGILGTGVVAKTIGAYPYGDGAERQKRHGGASAPCTDEDQLAEIGSGRGVGCAGGFHRSGRSSAS